ncbi:Fe-S cluster assembly ATPase SufC [Candidatus Woesearchaeota archaeon]|nr:Fe-S cluster assembly ATPase SufC [Candidatus Woesearchaeota archaeon]
MTDKLIIKNLHVKAEDKELLKGVNLEVAQGEIVALMGPNGSGKTTLANAVMGRPGYTITKGSITYRGKDLEGLPPDERARLGLFLSFQHPAEIPGLRVDDFLRELRERKKGKKQGIAAFRSYVKSLMDKLDIDQGFLERYLNQGFSGGEKKRMEILQMALLEPSMAILDETDSGLDIDALKAVAAGVEALRSPTVGTLIITHYKRILDYLKPDKVAVLIDGRIVREGGPELVDKLEAEGYAWAGKQ